jgi:hypothetical protein
MNTRADPAIAATYHFGVDPPCVSEGPTPSGYYPPNGGLNSDASGVVKYWAAGQAISIRPQPFYAGWYWYGGSGTFHAANDSVPSGFVDGPFGPLGNTVRICVVGPGTMTIHLRSGGGTMPDTQITEAIETPYVGYWRVLAVPKGADYVLVVPDDGWCYHAYDISQIWGIAAPTMFGGFTWASGSAGSGKQFLRGHVTFAAAL